MNGRVEKLKKSIVKETKAAKASGTAATGAVEGGPELAPSAAAFLAELRTETAKEVEQLRTASSEAAPTGDTRSSSAGSAGGKKKQRMVGGAGGGGW